MNNNLQKGGGSIFKSYCDRFNDPHYGSSGIGSTSSSGGNLTGDQERKFDTMAQQLEMLVKIATTNEDEREGVRGKMKESYDDFKKNDDQARADIEQADEDERRAETQFADAKLDAKKLSRFKMGNFGFLSRPRNDAIKTAKRARTDAINKARLLRDRVKGNFNKGREALSRAVMSNTPPSATADLQMEQPLANIKAEEAAVPQYAPLEYAPLEYERKLDQETLQEVEQPKAGRGLFSSLRPRFRRSSTPNTNMVTEGGTIKKKNKGQKITRKKINKKYKKSRNTKRQKYKKSGNTKRQKYKKSGNTKRQKSKKYRKNH